MRHLPIPLDSADKKPHGTTQSPSARRSLYTINRMIILTGSNLFEFFQLIEVFLRTLRERESADVHYSPSGVRGKPRAHGLVEDLQHYGLGAEDHDQYLFYGILQSKGGEQCG
jgi:hypothetical protein